jgi:hypothetical protein
MIRMINELKYDMQKQVKKIKETMNTAQWIQWEWRDKWNQRECKQTAECTQGVH